MIPSGVEVFVGLAPIDLRWGFDRLAGVVQEQFGRLPRSGALFVFIGKRKTALKVLFFDGTGLCLLYKRLDQGTFRLPEPTHAQASSVELSERELDELVDGIELQVKRPARQRRRPRLH